METQTAKFKKLEQVREIFTLVFVMLGVIIIQFPLPSILGLAPIEINKTGVYLSGAFLLAFSFLWHRIATKRMTGANKFFIETTVYVIIINFIVVFTGGIYSYFTFFYFLPLLNTSANLDKRSSILIALLISLLLSLQLVQLRNQRDFPNAVSLYVLSVFGIWLVTSLGRFLATEVDIIQKIQEEQRVEQIREIDKLKDEFVFIIAHELRSPITAIRGYLELITTSTDLTKNENLRSLLEKSFSTSNKIATMIGLLLEVARIETGKIRFYLQKIDIKNSVDLVLGEMRKEISQKEIQVTSEIPKANYVLFDKERLEEILMIVLDNAIKYTPEFGKVVISIQTTDKQVLLSVADTGIGVSAELKDKLYQKFYTQNSKTGEVEVRGFGVGLYVAKEILKRMDGDITCESYPGKGSTFTLQLPKYWNYSS